MTAERVAFVPMSGRHAVSAFRTWPELTGCETRAGLWILITSDSSRDEELVHRLQSETVAEWFDVTATRELIPRGRRVPVGMLPEGPWLPLRDLLPVRWPAANFAANRPGAVRLQLIRSDAEQVSKYLELELSVWSKLAVVTPEIRLHRWEFAASSEGRALVRGLPLPAVPGLRFADRNGLLVPAGYRWEPAVSPDVVRHLVNLSPDEIGLWRADTDQWERIPADAFVPARRANIRQTVVEFSATAVEP